MLKMALKLYALTVSPPCRAVSLVASALNIPLEYIEVIMAKQEHKTPEFIKMNPQHTIPTLDDNGFIIWDSHVIITYLINKYKPNSPLYPADPKKRATIDQRLHFDSGVLFAKLRHLIARMFVMNRTDMPQNFVNDMNQTYDFLEAFLDGNDWMAGPDMTVADLSLIATVTSTNIFVPIDKSKYPRLVAWIERCQALPYYAKDNQEGLNMLSMMIKIRRSKL